MAGADLPSGKLIVLFMLKQVRSIPSADLQSWAIESLYLDYFSFMQAKEELKRDHFMMEATRKGEMRKDLSGRPLELCDITPEGEIVLSQLSTSLPLNIQAYFVQTAQKWDKKAKQESSVRAAYDPDGNGAFRVRLSLLDGAVVTCELSLVAPDEEQAKKMCRRWKDSTAGIYKTLLQSLIEET